MGTVTQLKCYLFRETFPEPTSDLYVPALFCMEFCIPLLLLIKRLSTCECTAPAILAVSLHP